jgi:hypothetical protein
MERARFVEVVGWSGSVAEESMCMGKGEVALEKILLWGMKKVSSGEGDTLRQDAVKRAGSAVWVSDFMQPWPRAVENGVGVVPL